MKTCMLFLCLQTLAAQLSQRVDENAVDRYMTVGQ